MRAVVQRVKNAEVSIDEEKISEIQRGILVLCAFTKEDTIETLEWTAKRISKLRIFYDENMKLNKSVLDINGQAMIVSNFTLYGDCTRGTRPNFSLSAQREIARPLYEKFVEIMKEILPVSTGVFGGKMTLNVVADGPVTVIVEK